jgi:hypothetical protein
MPIIVNEMVELTHQLTCCKRKGQDKILELTFWGWNVVLGRR